MRTRRLVALILLAPFLGCAQEVPTRPSLEIVNAMLLKLANVVEPPAGDTPVAVSTRIKITKAAGLPKETVGGTVDLTFQAPDHLLLSAAVAADQYRLGRDGQEVWLYSATKHFGLLGKPGLPRFSTAPEKKDATQLGPIKLPLPKEQIALLTLLFKLETQPSEKIDGTNCHVVVATPLPQAREALKLPSLRLQLWIRPEDSLPVRMAYADDHGVEVQIEFPTLRLGSPLPPTYWQLQTGKDDQVESVAISHITRFLGVMLSQLNQKIPTLGPANGERRVIATEGDGRLEMIDSTRVLFLKGTPEEMGHQHGVLLKKQVRDLTDRILYGVGVGSSFAKAKWFIAEIESAQKRLAPFMDQRYVREMDALALAVGAEPEEIRLANFFPELFHCSGFALFGDATVGGKLYHGRILDYMRGLGLEQNAVVMIFQPAQGNAWVNIGYAGFVGSVTAMNEKQVAIGEMGGRGQGQWDGKPMAQLLREVMEKANTLDEAVEIMRRGPRTCEYYYVISDAKTHRAVGIAATPTSFETISPGQSHPLLPHPFKDAVLMSAGDRYEKLAERVKGGYGKFAPESARDLMTRPVCMPSNLHSVLFAPDTLDFWVANADSANVASHTRYTHYNLRELLNPKASVHAEANGTKAN